jgi:PleD family two-component response regulator
MKKVLVIGRHADMLAKVVVMLTQNGYAAIGAIENNNALELFQTYQPTAVVIGGGVDVESRNLFKQKFSSAKIIEAHPHTVLSDLNLVFQ